MNDIDVDQQNLRPFKSLEVLVENPLKKCVFFHNKLLVLGKGHYHKKKRKDFIGGHNIIFSFSFGLVMCYELET